MRKNIIVNIHKISYNIQKRLGRYEIGKYETGMSAERRAKIWIYLI